MGGRLNTNLASVWMCIAVVSALVWFWKMGPVLVPHMMTKDYILRSGWVWWTILFAGPPIAVMAWMDRVCAILMHRPGFWTRHR